MWLSAGNPKDEQRSGEIAGQGWRSLGSGAMAAAEKTKALQGLVECMKAGAGDGKWHTLLRHSCSPCDRGKS